MFRSGNYPPDGRGRGRFMDGFLRHLPWLGGANDWLEGIELNDEQVEQIADLKHKSMSQMGHGKVDMMDLMQSLFKELGNSSIDQAKVMELKEKIKAQKSSMTDLMVDNMLAFSEILSAEQRKKIRINKIRQFLGSGDHEHGHDRSHQHQHPHQQGHHPPPHDPGRF